MITLADLPDEVCFGETYQIYCIHPVLDVSSYRGYITTNLQLVNIYARPRCSGELRDFPLG